MSNLKTKDLATPINPDGCAWLCAMIGGMAGLVLAYKITAMIGFHLVIVHWGIPFNIGNLVTFAVIVAGVLLVGAHCYYLGSLIDKRLSPRARQAPLIELARWLLTQPKGKGERRVH